ncbi:hypothetical protein WJU23_05325 [Prosthecobacter sp. SYSU 5D2]|uniref:hypothetical protein n=1 Tax=Prosthecobacter sp. SYSU 5D2 TaxID=3134134 RepID=UPI0031FF0AF6
MPKAKSTPLLLEEENTQEAPKPSWPESQEHRILRCDLSEKETQIYGKEQAELHQEIDSLEEEKKSSASNYKARIEEKGARARRIGNYITSGWQEKDVQCSWIYETAGRDQATGEMIFHPEKKSLVRDDTGEVVEIREITNEERQMALPMDTETQENA